MPEPYQPKRKQSFTLFDAHKMGALIKVRCRYDKREMWFVADDLRIAYGDIEVDDVRWAITCSKCGGEVEVTTDFPPAEKRQAMTLRRLVRVDYIRRPVWRDGKG